jgi:hypothetical protein
MTQRREVEKMNVFPSGLLRAFEHRWKIVALSALLVALSFTMFSPVKSVKGLLVNTGIAPTNGFLSIDAGRVAFTVSSGVGIYDINSASSVSFGNPSGVLALAPQISGDRVLVAGGTNITSPVTIYYCTLPHASPIQSCGSWTAIVSGLPSIVSLANLGSFPEIVGDMVVWDNVSSFGFYRFSSGSATTVSTSTQAHGLTTNGAIIAFSAKPTSASASETIRFYDTSLASGSRTIVDTGLAGYYPSITQYTIAFNDNSTAVDHLRYYDILRNQASSAGTGPAGTISYANNPSIWGNRIVFVVDEVTDNFDCNGDGTKSSTEFCLGYWNIRGASYIATTLSPSAAPAIKGTPVIYDNIVVFEGSSGTLQYVTVPMQGDVNQDGVVNSTDKTDVTNCLNQLLKGSVC